MARIDRVELLSGVLVFAVGAYFFFAAQDYRMGTVARMGPGFVPHWLGAMAMGLGVVIALTGIGVPGRLPGVAPRAAAAVLGAIAAFALLLPHTGLVVAVFTTTLVAILGNPAASPRMALATAAVVSALCWGLFIGLLGLPMIGFRAPW